MSFLLANVAGRAALAHGGQVFDLETVSGGALGPDPMAAIAAFEHLHRYAETLAEVPPIGALDDVDLRSPVPAPVNVFAVGLNYADHVAESGMEAPEAPVVFTKFPTCIAGPKSPVLVPNGTIDYEAEMVVVIGRGGADISAADAWSHIAGVTGGQDISDRGLQWAAKPAHFDLAKSRDGYGPLGPVLASVDSLEDPDDITVECLVNGVSRQASSTRHLIFDVPFLVAYLSSILTLRSGDIIFTGTPDGVGMATGDYLKPGDVIETRIGGVGSFTNPCVAP